MRKFSEKNLLTPIEIHTLKETINFLRNAYLETEDVDGNIVKADKDMARKLKDFYDKLKLMIYNNNGAYKKYPKLKEAFEILINNDISLNALHDALYDAHICLQIFCKLNNWRQPF